jgi:glycosyltransferase involved in cell wall biosynthesis
MPDPRTLEVARELRRQGHEATLVVAQFEFGPLLPAFQLACEADGFACIPITAAHLCHTEHHFPWDPGLATARALTSIVRAFDVAWFFEPSLAMPALRERRFRDRPLPLFVLSTSDTEDEPLPASLDDLNRVFASQYAGRWADLVFSAESVSKRNALEAGQTIRQVEALWQKHQASPPREIPVAATSPAVTVCIPHFEAPAFLPETLASLERQTTNDFTVIVVDDGSFTPEANAVFDQCAGRYASRGWRFLRQKNQSPGSARNRAVRECSSEFLLFLDADDIAMAAMIERFLRAALISGDDCLVAINYGFRTDPEGPCAHLYDPPGNNLIASMGDDMHGGSCIFVRREAFNKLGGFTDMRGVGFEDYEFHVRANLNNLKWDVLPDLVYRYRMPRENSVSRSTNAYPNLRRVLRWYEERLRPTSLGQLPLAFASAYWNYENLRKKAEDLQHMLSSRRHRPSPRGRELKLLILACDFPFGANSGWHTRVREMLRYFGSRYEVTLMTCMAREQHMPVKKEAFRYVHALRAVEWSDCYVAQDEDMPFLVRRKYTDTFQAAMQALPTDRYHAAILDQIFMAEFRNDIDTLSVLTEHNIESQLLRQASKRAWEDDDLPLTYKNPLIEAERLERYEDRAWADFPLRTAVSEVDRAQMDLRAPRGKTILAPNGADLGRWLPNLRFKAATVIFPGHLHYLPNVDGVQFLLSEIWPKVRRQRPKARLLIAGYDPSDAVKAAVSQAGHASAGIELISSPKSMDRVARRASISIAPLRLGSGTRCKILESMAWGLPVVSTTLGAEGIAAVDGEHLFIRDDPDAFAEAMVRLLSDEPLWLKFRNNGRELIREHYCWDRVFEPFNDALLDLIL